MSKKSFKREHPWFKNYFSTMYKIFVHSTTEYKDKNIHKSKAKKIKKLIFEKFISFI